MNTWQPTECFLKLTGLSFSWAKPEVWVWFCRAKRLCVCSLAHLSHSILFLDDGSAQLINTCRPQRQCSCDVIMIGTDRQVHRQCALFSITLFRACGLLWLIVGSRTTFKLCLRRAYLWPFLDFDTKCRHIFIAVKISPIYRKILMNMPYLVCLRDVFFAVCPLMHTLLRLALCSF